MNQDCPVRNREKHYETHLENFRLKGQMREKEAETAALKNKVEEIAKSMAMLLSGEGTPDAILNRMKDIAERHSDLSSPLSPPPEDPGAGKPKREFFPSCRREHRGCRSSREQWSRGTRR